MFGVIVSLIGDRVVGIQLVIINVSGFYCFLNFLLGEYMFFYVFEGFKMEQCMGVCFNVGCMLIENVIFSFGDVSEMIIVMLEVLIVDMVLNEVGINFDQDWIENVFVQCGLFNDFVVQVLGVLCGGDESCCMMVFGFLYDENLFQLDGVDVNDNFFNEQLVQLNIDVIEEIEVLLFGVLVEYGNLIGVVYNIVMC